MIHLDPDFKTLNETQRNVALNCLYGLTQHGNEKRPSGVTQTRLIHAIGTALLGIEHDIKKARVDQIALTALKREFEGVEEDTRHRLFSTLYTG